MTILGMVPACAVAQIQPASPGLRIRHVILKSGSVFSGAVDVSGQQTTVRTDSGVVVRLEQDQIDFIADSLDYAASRLANRIVGDGAQEHLQLANWCLRYGALSAAQREIDWLRRWTGETADVRDLQRRLDQGNRELRGDTADAAGDGRNTAEESPEMWPADGNPRTRQLPPSEPQMATHEELRQAVESLSRQARRDFTSQVHNRIVAGCATARCHGHASSAMRLWRPNGARGLDSTSAQRNLHAMLQQINRTNPPSSPFLEYLSRPHGGQETATFEINSSEWKEIRDWVISTALSPTVADGQTGSDIRQASWEEPADPAHAGLPGPVPPQPVDLLSTTRRAAPVSTDPFDPDMFNRQFADPVRTPRQPAVAVPPGKSRPLPPVDVVPGERNEIRPYR